MAKENGSADHSKALWIMALSFQPAGQTQTTNTLHLAPRAPHRSGNVVGRGAVTINTVTLPPDKFPNVKALMPSWSQVLSFPLCYQVLPPFPPMGLVWGQTTPPPLVRLSRAPFKLPHTGSPCSGLQAPLPHSGQAALPPPGGWMVPTVRAPCTGLQPPSNRPH